MSHPRVHWFAGAPALTRNIERAINAVSAFSDPLQSNPRRTIYQLELTESSTKSTGSVTKDKLSTVDEVSSDFPSLDAVVKIHHRRDGIRRVRDRLKCALGWDSTAREWAGLEHMSALNVPCAVPLAWGRVLHGDDLLVMGFIDGQPLAEALTTMSAEVLAQAATDLARSISRLHDAGMSHGDLHQGNLLFDGSRIVILDAQRLRRTSSSFALARDWAQLDASLERAAIRNGPSDLARQFETFRLELRNRNELGPALDKFRLALDRDYQRGRARRTLRIGRRWKALQLGPGVHGIAEEQIDDEEIRRSFSEIQQTVDLEARRGGRVRIGPSRLGDQLAIVKQVQSKTLGRALADRIRGSAGGRAFRRGQRAQLLNDRSPKPLAYAETRRFGVPVASWCWMERVGDMDLDIYLSESPQAAQRVSSALGEWLGEAHSQGFRHRDLKASNVRLTVTAERIRFWVVDLEDLEELGTASEAERIGALAQLNASIPDGDMNGATRWEGLEAYAHRLPFDRPLSLIARDIAKRSLSRQHRWKGIDCDFI